MVIEKANGDRERHRCPSELALKVNIAKGTTDPRVEFILPK